VSAFQAPPGTRDLLAPESARFAAVVATFARHATLAGYGLVISPMFEDAAVFRRGVGEASDVVTKEMYEFEDKGGRLLALRPEATASIVRAFVQHRPPVPWKAWYVTPAFRYERPQAGRYRQHHQVGVEALGSEDPDLDVEVITLLAGFLTDCRVGTTELSLSSLGDGTCRPAYLENLVAYLEANETGLCDEHRATWRRNPLRVLDCKTEACRAVAKGAPHLIDALCDPCAAHFAAVRAGLDALGVSYRVDPYLVRGLDYYTRTTFEFAAADLAGAQNALGGGGRYDGLAAALGGPETPGIGFAAGLERILLAAGDDAPGGGPPVAVFVVDVTGGLEATMLCAELRAAGIATERAFDGRSLKAQLRQADRSGARVAAIVGEREREAGTVTLRTLVGEGAGGQSSVGRREVVAALGGLLA
jgi:histidyl-tRNA synthetase